MLRSQKLKLRQSEISKRLAEIQIGDDVDDEQRAEIDKLIVEYRCNETDFGAAIITEEAERQANAPEDGASREHRSLVEQFEVRQIVGHLTENHRVLSGPTAELVEEMRSQKEGGFQGLPVPFEALADIETRADTVSSGTPDPQNVRPIIDRLFAGSVAQQVGVRTVNIPFGTVRYPIAGTGASFGWAPTEGGDITAAVAFSTNDQILQPDHNGGARIDLTRTAMHQSGPGLEQAVRRDMRNAIREGMDAAVFLGTGAAGQPEGIFVDANVPTTAVGATASYSAFLAAAVEFMLDNAATSPQQIRILSRPELWGFMGDDLISGISITEWDRVVAQFGAPIMSNNAVAAPLAGPPVSVSALLTTDAGGIPPAWVGLWGGVDVIVDPYTGAAAGTLKLTGLITADVAISRTEQLRTLTGLQLA